MLQEVRRPALAPLAVLLLLAPVADAAHDNGSGPRSLGGATVPSDGALLARIEAEDFADKPVGEAVEDPQATGGKAWRMPRYGLLSTSVEVPETGVAWLRVRARGEHPPGLMTTHMHPVVDGRQRGEWDVGPTWTVYTQAIPMAGGRHVLSVDNFNNYHAPADDRTLVVDWVELLAPTLEGVPHVGQAAEVVVDGPEVHMAGTGLARRAEPDARDGAAWLMWGVGCFVEAVVFDHAGPYRLQAWLRGNERQGEGSHVTVLLDGKRVDEFHAGDAWAMREAPLQARAGASVLEICYDNDHGGPLKRNLWLDEMRLQRVGETPRPATPTPATPTPGTPAPSTPPPVPTPPVETPPAEAAPEESHAPVASEAPAAPSARVPFPGAALVALALLVALAVRRR